MQSTMSDGKYEFLKNFSGMFAIISACLLVGDMITDCLNVWKYWELTFKKNGQVGNFFSQEFYTKGWSSLESNDHVNDTTWTREPGAENLDIVREAVYFYCCAGFMLLPMVVATLFLIVYLQYVYSMEIRQLFLSCCSDGTHGQWFAYVASYLIAPLTFLLCIFLSLLVIIFGWVVFPILRVFYSFFICFGNKPSGIDSRLKGKYWKRFATFVMFLSIIETLFEALPQSVLNVIFFINELSEDDFNFRNYSIQIVSLIFSFISIMKTIGTMSWTTTYDWNNSFLGLVNSLRQSYKEKKRREDAEEERERLRVVCNEFGADLKISGFENCSDLDIARFLEQRGIQHEILMDEDTVYADGACVIQNVSVINSMLYMKSLRGQECKESLIRTHCSVHLLEPEESNETPPNGQLANVSEDEHGTRAIRDKEKKSIVQKLLPKQFTCSSSQPLTASSSPTCAANFENNIENDK